MSIKSKQIYRIARQVWGKGLSEVGFLEKNGEYRRALPSGVVHLIGIGKDPHGAESFRVLSGVNASLAAYEPSMQFGYIKFADQCHLTPKGWDINSGRWSCATEEDTRGSILKIWEKIRELAIPWLDRHKTLSSVAEEIDTRASPMHGWKKAKLYMLDGDFPRAHAAIAEYAAWAALPKSWLPEKAQKENMERAAQVLREIEEAEKFAKQA